MFLNITKMNNITPKKQLGQHFLIDLNIAKKIVNSLTFHKKYNSLLEIGSGKGILTKILLNNKDLNFKCIEKDKAMVDYLISELNIDKKTIISGDFLKINLKDFFDDEFGVIGNFPYNISSQILFKVLDNHAQIPELVGMFQKEVAERIVANSGNKVYGILSVMVQAYYKVEYLFTVSENVFIPPPKIKSAVIRLTRKETDLPTSDYPTLKKIVNTAFQQRRKMLRNSLKSIFPSDFDFSDVFFTKRPEQLNFCDFDKIGQMFIKGFK